MGAESVLTDDEETDTVWTTTVLLRVDLSLCHIPSRVSMDRSDTRVSTVQTVCDCGYETVDWYGAVEEHARCHCLLAHEVAARAAIPRLATRHSSVKGPLRTSEHKHPK